MLASFINLGADVKQITSTNVSHAVIAMSTLSNGMCFLG